MAEMEDWRYGAELGRERELGFLPRSRSKTVRLILQTTFKELISPEVTEVLS